MIDSQAETDQNTRTEIFELLDHWLSGTGSEWKEKRTFYMWGHAGIGKSTIAVEYCRRLHESGHLGASFFFTRGAQGLESTDHVFPSIAAQLAYSQPALYEPIVSAAREYLKWGKTQQMEYAFDQLVKNPLETLPPSHPPTVIVIDALDENDKGIAFFK